MVHILIAMLVKNKGSERLVGGFPAKDTGYSHLGSNLL